MNTTQLECFITLAGTLNYMKAAGQIGLTQPAVSKQLQSLERELGGQLFFRTTRSVSLTQAGERFLPQARQILSELCSAKELISKYARGEQRKFRIGYLDSGVLGSVGRILRAMSGRCDGLEPELIADQTDANLARLKQGRLDAVIGMRDSRFTDSSVVFAKIRDESFCCVAGESDPSFSGLEDGGSVDAADLWELRQILLVPPYLMRNAFSKRRFIVPVNDAVGNIICRSSAEALELARAGFGYAMVPPHQIPFPHPGLKVLKWPASPAAPFGIYYESEEREDKDLRLFISEARRCFCQNRDAQS